jgi:TonB-linked SusC/RagA family outer membrane protein
LLGFDAQKSRVESIGMNGNNFPNDDIPWLSNATNITSWSNVVTEYSLLSLYSRLNYNYKSKYLLSVSIRQDGSSRFGSNNRWGSFPSVSAGWIISDENFAMELPVVNYLKLRAEYGVVGNYNIGNYSHFGNIIPTNYVFGNSLAAGYSQGTIGNSELGWETTEGMGVGLDIGAFKDRVALSFDYYNKSTTDMLYQVDIPWGTGFSNIQDNIGEFHFWGYEVTLDTKNLVGSFKWNTNFNISINRNEVIKLGTNNTPIGASSLWINNVNRTEVGHPIGVFYGFLSDGVYMTQEEFDTQPKHYTSMVGTGRYKDINKDGVIDNYDRTFIGDPNPKCAFGISNSFSYKNFDLDVIITGAYGGDRARTLLEWSEILEGNFNVEKYVIDRWRSPESPGAGIIGRTFSGTTEFPETAQSRWIEDASYLTVKSISLGYNILPKIKRFSKARVFVSVQQAVVLTKYNGPNPEASAFGLNGLREGIDDAGYPVPRTFAFGLDFSF